MTKYNGKNATYNWIAIHIIGLLAYCANW